MPLGSRVKEGQAEVFTRRIQPSSVESSPASGLVAGENRKRLLGVVDARREKVLGGRSFVHDLERNQRGSRSNSR